MEKVVLVNELDETIGTMEKMEAHQKGLLHRAFSVFLFNDKHELLLQKRAGHKYHSGGLWTNTCCSHPRLGEEIIEAGSRRLIEEMGIQCELEQLFTFKYKASLDHDLIEHELDHVLIGYFNDKPEMNPDEVEDWKYMNLEQISEDMANHPSDYTAWFRFVFNEVKTYVASQV